MLSFRELLLRRKPGSTGLTWLTRTPIPLYVICANMLNLRAAVHTLLANLDTFAVVQYLAACLAQHGIRRDSIHAMDITGSGQVKLNKLFAQLRIAHQL